MIVRILDEVEQDLIDSFRFYETREAGLGDYFLDSLRLYAGMRSVLLLGDSRAGDNSDSC